MTQKELRDLVIGGESTTVEFKRKATSPHKIAREICALANTKGGVIFFGIDDDGSARGIESEKSEMDIINTACQFEIYPPIEPEFELYYQNNKEILVLIVRESPYKPHKIEATDEKGKKVKRAYIRVADKSIMASSEMARLLKTVTNSADKELKIVIGEKEKALLNYLEKYGRATVDDFCNLVNISRRRAERLIIRLVQAGIVQIHTDLSHDYFALV